ncbi:Zinc finger BED domain-containing protein RICESLEEPER 2 [Linum perenne]
MDVSNKRSDLWSNWVAFVDPQGVKKAKCVFCGAILKADPNSIGCSSLIRHTKNCKKRREVLQGQMRLNLQAETGLGTTEWTYCEKRLRMKIAKMIIKEELPFNFVEREGFKDVIAEASPYFKMPCRKSIRADCLRLFIEGKEELKLLLNQKCDGRVSITTDCWTSIQNFNYICITAHFVGVDWKLHKRIINFRRIFSHKGVDIAHILATCLEEWNLTNLMSVTVDNASANDTAIRCLKDKQINVWGTGLLEGKYMHMRCIAHITNLIVSHGLSHMGMSVRRVREAVKYVRSSPTRAARFKDCAVFKRIPCTKLVSMDVATRWNSTYLMLASAEPYEVAFKSLEADDPHFVSELSEKVHGDEVIGHPTHEDWVNVRNLLPFLGAFHDLTLVASGTKYVTAHLCFDQILKIITHIRRMQASDDERIGNMADSMLEKLGKYWDEQDGTNSKLNRLVYIASVLDPRHKLHFAKYAFTKLYGAVRGAVLLRELKEELTSLFMVYEAKRNSSTNASQQTSTSFGSTVGTPTSVAQSVEHLDEYLVGINVTTHQKSDLDIYLDLDREDAHTLHDVNFKYDVLGWWKNNGHRHPVLCEMVRDIFGVPISTVPSESAFSTSGRVLDSFRSSLSPSIAEALFSAVFFFCSATAIV